MSQPARKLLEASALRAVARLSSVVRGAGVYSLQHPAMSRSLEGVQQSFVELVEEGGPVTLRLRDDAVILGDRSINPGVSGLEALGLLVPLLQKLEVGGLSLKAVPSTDECLALAQVLLQGGAGETTGFAAAVAALAAARVESLELLPLDTTQHREWHTHELPPELSCLAAYLDAIHAVHQLYRDGLDPGVVVRLTRAGQELVETVLRWPSRAALLVSPRQHLDYELRHPVHVAILSALLGTRLGLEKGQLLELVLCAFSIDCGMVTIPESIRQSTTPLSAKERALIEAHPIESIKALMGAPSLSPSVRRRMRVAFESHLQVDAQGYPTPMRWGELHLYSRIVALADGYDAMRADTPYRKSMTQALALSTLHQQAGKRYDPVLTELLVDTVRQLQARLDREDPHAR